MAHYFLYRDLYIKAIKLMRENSPRLFAGVSDEQMRKDVAYLQFKNFGLTDRIAVDLLMYEWMHMKYGRPTYFIEDMKLLHFLESANFKLQPEHLIPPSKVISIAVPTQAQELRGFLFVRLTPEEHEDAFQKWFDWAGIHTKAEKDDRNLEHFAAAFESPVDKGRIRCVVPVEKVDEALSKKWFEHHISEGSLLVPNQTEAELQGRILSLGMRFLAYMSAFPELVKPGLPENMKLRDKKMMPKNSRTIQMHPVIRDSPAAHYRSHHFRTLADPRYRRDEQGNVRVVWVRPALVGGKRESFTAEAPE
jgi:hypothetical protein